MIPVTTFSGQDVAVFGLARSGMATCRALGAGGARAHAWDDNADTRAAAARAGLPLTELSAESWSRFAALVLAPGVPLTHPKPHWTVAKAQAAGVPIIGDVEVFARERQANAPDAPFIAITGTNGKSTTTALITHVLRQAGNDAQMGGNIGVPILELDPPADGRIHVIELSSYQIDLMPTLTPTIGVLLNISPDHLDRHGTFAHYAAVKRRILDHAQWTIIGVDDTTTREIATAHSAGIGGQATAISGGLLALGMGVRDGHVLRFTNGNPEPLADINDVVSLRGRHNAQNAAAASVAASIIGLSDSEIAAGLQTFPGLPHRMEEVARRGPVIFINDSKATNADSAANALASFECDIYWIAGGLAKDGGISDLEEYFARIARAYLIGEAAADFAATLDGRIAYAHCDTLANAVAMAADDAGAAVAGEPVVLLSPACASFDQFASFEVRGDAFRDLVAALPGAAIRERPEL
ncbi:MAG: UDP-N-acetylmuramoyl-L-alanine--D-glutamate ligase [Hyphomicrobiaceae bacterium]